MATKQKSAICAVLTILLCTVMFLAGCSIDDPDPGSRYEPPVHDYGIWSPETFNRIIHDSRSHICTGVFIPFLGNHSLWVGYYGTYSGSHALIFIRALSWYRYTGQEVIETVAGISFTFPCRASAISIWNNGTFYTLTEAFALDLLSREDVQNIAEIYQTRGLDFAPLPFDDFAYDYSVWSEQTRIRFIQATHNYWIIFGGYFGAFSGSHVFLMRLWCPFDLIDPWITSVAGFDFVVHGQTYIIVWKNGVFYSLDNAYILGLLTPDDIQSLHEKFLERGSSGANWPPDSIIFKE